MGSELKRGAVRIASNYARLLSVVVFGLLLTKLLIRGFGRDAYAMIMLLGSTMGIVEMIKEVVRSSMIRELGAAYHSSEPGAFVRAYNSAIALSGVIGVFTVLGFAATWLVLPLLEIPPVLLGAGRWFVIAKGVEGLMIVLMAPMVNMYIVQERMVANNVILTLHRAVYFVSAATVLALIHDGDPARGVVIYGWISAGLFGLVQIASSAWMIRTGPDFVPRLSQARRAEVISIIKLGGWNTGVVTATNLMTRIAQILMNLAFGLLGNTCFALAFLLTSSVRRIALGMTDGLDAVSARLSSGEHHGQMRSLLRHSTRLHAFVAFPSSLCIAMLAEPVLRLWVEKDLDDPENVIPRAASMVGILSFGFAVRAVGESWQRILYGSGNVHRYAKLIIAGGVAYPIIVGVLLWGWPLGENALDSWRFDVPALVFAAMFTSVHFLCLPGVVASCNGLSYWEVFSPVIRPAVATLAGLPVFLAGSAMVGRWNLWSVGLVVIVYGVVYAAMTWVVTLNTKERRDVVGMGRRLTAKVSRRAA